MNKQEKQELQERGFHIAIGAAQALGLITGAFLILAAVSVAAFTYFF